MTRVQTGSMSFAAVAHRMENGVFAVNGTSSYFIDVMHKGISFDVSELKADELNLSMLRNVNNPSSF